MNIECKGSYWLAHGEGPLRPIIAEGASRQDAEDQFNKVYGDQYARSESLTALALLWEDRK